MLERAVIKAAGQWSVLALVLALWGCSPALNWRDVRLPSGRLSGLLPCKPVASGQAVDLAGARVQLTQLSCMVDGATYALAETQVQDPARVSAALAHWRLAVLQNVKADAPQEADLGVPGAPGPVKQVSALGQHPGGGILRVQAAWWAVGSHLHHAVVYSPPGVSARTRQETEESFFGGLRAGPP